MPSTKTNEGNSTTRHLIREQRHSHTAKGVGACPLRSKVKTLEEGKGGLRLPHRGKNIGQRRV